MAKTNKKAAGARSNNGAGKSHGDIKKQLMEPAERLIVLGYSTVLFVVIGLSALGLGFAHECTQVHCHRVEGWKLEVLSVLKNVAFSSDCGSFVCRTKAPRTWNQTSLRHQAASQETCPSEQ
ncbi:hypothetical protein ACFSHT_28700 [Paraburkholderia silviterrae]|uniref:Uncharacterized protein n=1 Tax=Paraburkholderia silviterrae TaxID=2528715 RepID=A0A4R5M5N3_9BURK|nr:hypothetical protein [Paraburkholderia silviterrae]TDG21191.1 hypothetical protein EYW47_22765 [Paraburkholderia silviterrae]